MKSADYKTLSDESLFELYREGETAAFDLYYERVSPRIFGFIKRRVESKALAEEIFQEVWMKIHRARDQYDSKFPLNPWIFTVVRSVLFDGLRSMSRKKELFLEVKELGQKIDEKSMETSIQAGVEENAKVFFEALQNEMSEELTLEQKKLIDLRYLSDWSFDEIARSLGLSEENVRQKISRSLRKLRRRLAV